MQINITNLIDDGQCYQTVRGLRWPDGVKCPSCQSTQVIKRGFDDTEPARQRYECHDCDTRLEHYRQGYLSTSGRHRKIQWNLSNARCPNVPNRDGQVVSPSETSFNTPPAARPRWGQRR